MTPRTRSASSGVRTNGTMTATLSSPISSRAIRTARHRRAIRAHGLCPAHRLSFDFLREIQGECSDSFYELKDELFSCADRTELARWEARREGDLDALAEPERRKLRLLLARRYRTV